MTPSFGGLRVLALESRRATEVAALITAHGGVPVVAPALREVALDATPATRAFCDALMAGQLDMVIFLTGVGARALLDNVAATHGREAMTRALAATRVVARGPKPMAVLRDLGIPAWAVAAEPNTWHELLVAIDAAAGRAVPLEPAAQHDDASADAATASPTATASSAATASPTATASSAATAPPASAHSLAGARVAVQEYGAEATELVDALRARGAEVASVPVYRWALPDDVAPLERAVRALVDGALDVVLFTTGVHVDHLWQVARTLGVDGQLPAALARVVVASIGPTTTQALRRHGVSPDLEPSHPKMGVLVREAAEQSPAALARKRPPV